jgi:hypothetical protein
MQDQNIKIRIDAVDNTKKAFNDLQGSLKDSSNSLFSFQNALKSYITFELARKIFDISASFQDMKVALNQVTGSAEQGGRAFDFLNKFSETSRFNIKDLSNAFILLYRSGINPTEELLKTFTDTAAATQQPLETLNALILLFTKGTEGGMGILQFRRLESEGIPVFKLLREQFGLSKDGVEDYLKTVKGSEYVLELLRKSLAKTFGGTEAANANNLSTTFDDVKNAAEKFAASLGDAGLNKVLSQTFILLKDLIDLIKNSEIAKFLGLIGSGIGIVADKIGQGVEAYKKAKKGYQEAIGMGGKAVIAPEAPQKPEQATILLDVYKSLNTATESFDNQWKNINETISKGTLAAIKSVSQGIAESIILGKKLETSFKEIAQKILVNILANLIEEQIVKLAIIALDQLAIALGLQQLIIERKKTEEKRKQAELDGRTTGTQKPTDTIKDQLDSIFGKMWEKLKQGFSDAFDFAKNIFDNLGNYVNDIFNSIGNSVSSIVGDLSNSIGDIFNSISGSLGDILSSVGNIFGGSGGGGGGGGFDLGTLIDIGSMLFAAEGGAITAGQPYVVGERGRELFIPNQSGTMIPNHDLGTTGGTSINFTINATDVRGVQELLINNRATITNLVNQALNQRGKSSIV